MSLRDLKHMIKTCEDYTGEYHILFNPTKSKLLCYNLSSDATPNVTLCGTIADIVDQEKHKGNKLSDDIHGCDMKGLISEFYRRSNAVITNFNMCDSQTLNLLHSVFCSSLYGIELFNWMKKDFRKFINICQINMPWVSHQEQ